MKERDVPCLSGGDCEDHCPFLYILPGSIGDAAKDAGTTYDEMASMLRQKSNWAIRQLLKHVSAEAQCKKEATIWPNEN